MNERVEKSPSDRSRRGCGSFTRPGLAIPCRVARQQSPAPFRQTETV